MTLRRFLLSLVLVSVSVNAAALETKKFCMYDPVGKNGPAITFFSDLKAKAIAWGLDIELNAYTDEKVAANDWNGAVFAAAGLERINLKPDSFINLDWMIPAPAQGASGYRRDRRWSAARRRGGSCLLEDHRTARPAGRSCSCPPLKARQSRWSRPVRSRA